MPDVPEIEGTIEISLKGEDGIFIGGDPAGLRSLAKILEVLADFNQEWGTIPHGDREHFHLHPGHQLSKYSVETEVCRLDAAGTGEFPAGYSKKKK